MSGIVSSVGLFSGIPYQDLIDQLLRVEGAPYLRVLKRIEGLQNKRASYAELNARLLALKSAAGRFDQVSFFRRNKATSSHPEVLSAIAAEGAVPGSYSFRVQSLVSSHQLISAGFADADETAVGSGQLSVEVGEGKLARRTFLDDLNGVAGVGRGVIEIQDRAGNVSEIDLTSALTVDDVLRAINNDPQIQVQASVSGDALVITDTSGGTTHNLTVQDVGSTTTARDLGIRKSAAGDTIRGDDINDVSADTKLSLLNDGNGVRRNQAGDDLLFMDGALQLFGVELNDTLKHSTHLQQLNDGNGVSLGQFEIHTRSGEALVVDLATPFDFGDGLGPRGVETIEDVLAVINDAAAQADIEVEAQLELGTSDLQILDHTTGGQSFEISDVNGSAANDLGLAGQGEEGVITSPKIFRISSLGDVVRAINFAPDNYDRSTGGRQVTAMVGDNGLTLVGTDGQAFAVEAGGTSSAAEDLGLSGSGPVSTLVSRPLIAGLNTVLLRSLNGGSGVSTDGDLLITNKLGQLVRVSLDGVHAVQEVLDAINEQSQDTAAGIRASLNAAQNGIVLVDETGGAQPLSVADNQTAADLGFGGGAAIAGTELNSGNLQRQYISETTRLQSLHHGEGIGTGDFRITTSAGQSFRVSITDNQKTIGDVIAQINNVGESIGILARVNDQGDGILVTDSSGGGGVLNIEDDGGQVASRLNLLRDAAVEDTVQHIDGSFEVHIVIDADDTLNDVAEKINDANLELSAAVISDGSSSNAFHLAITSTVSGTNGELMFDPGSTALGMIDLVKPQDAVIYFGGGEATNPIVIRSSSNTVNDVIQNVTINLLASGEEQVQLTVSRDVDAAAESIQLFVSAYNDVIDRIDDLTYFEPETLQSGVLRGESTVNTVLSRLRSMVNAEVPTEDPQFSRLSSIGITIATGGRLNLNEDKFRDAFGSDPAVIEELFTLSELRPELDSAGNPVLDPQTGKPREEFLGLGLGFRIDELLDLLTRNTDGLLSRRDDALEDQEEVLNVRAELLQDLLEAKRARLESQFASLEQALATLSGQQSSLNILANSVPTSIFGS